ncbi:MAG: V-type ATP synthase subunit C [Oscillospiraceae bacterium]|nr:V-type ATP synthase subunit C [Oscillospiraceae bacterium]
MGNHSYAYAMGRVRAVERKMLGRSQFDRMIEARTADDAFRVLHEAGYSGAGGASGVGAGASPDAQHAARDYELLLDAENERLAAFVTEISPEPRLLNFFLLRFDYHNLKVLLKTEFSGAAGGPALSHSGVIAPDKLAANIRERELFALPDPMAEGVMEAIKAYQHSVSIQSPDPQCVDIHLDRAMYAHMMGEAKALGSPFMEQLTRINIDLVNIGSFLRMRGMGKSAEFMRGALVPGGSVGYSVFARFLQDDLDGFVGAMQHTPYSGLCEEGAKSYRDTGRMTVFERRADDFVSAFIKKVKLYPIGLELIAAYFVARQTEFKNIRIIMVGKINGIAQDVIRERLRESYV